jgi:autotransporter-associated beta strand protein
MLSSKKLTGSVGSLAGTGLVHLNSFTLTTGGDNTTTTYSGALSGTGGLIKTGVGTFSLIGGNTYSGGTTFNGGVLGVNNDGNLGAATGDLIFNGGTLQTLANAFSSAPSSYQCLGRKD